MALRTVSPSTSSARVMSAMPQKTLGSPSRYAAHSSSWLTTLIKLKPGLTQEVDVGLAADIGTLARLPKLAGNQSMVHELAYTARDFTAAEADKMGLVSKVVPGGRDEVLRAALDTAKLIAKKSPIAVLSSKKILQHARDHS